MAKGNFSFSSSLKIECTQTNLFSSNDYYFKAETADLKISKGDAKRDCTGFFCFVLLLVMPFCFVFLLWIRHKWVTRQTSRVIEYLKKNNHSIVSTRSEKKPKKWHNVSSSRWNGAIIFTIFTLDFVYISSTSFGSHALICCCCFSSLFGRWVMIPQVVCCSSSPWIPNYISGLNWTLLQFFFFEWNKISVEFLASSYYYHKFFFVLHIEWIAANERESNHDA